MGNIVPLVPSVICAVLGYGLGLGVWSIGLGAAVSLPLISRFGFWENALIRAELLEKFAKGGILVGIVYEQPADWLDAHAEIGLLNIEKSMIIVQTEEHRLKVPLNSQSSLRRKFNIHQLVGLGGWIVVSNPGVPDLLIESREADTMFQSKLRTNELFETVKKEKGGS